MGQINVNDLLVSIANIELNYKLHKKLLFRVLFQINGYRESQKLPYNCKIDNDGVKIYYDKYLQHIIQHIDDKWYLHEHYDYYNDKNLKFQNNMNELFEYYKLYSKEFNRIDNEIYNLSNKAVFPIFDNGIITFHIKNTTSIPLDVFIQLIEKYRDLTAFGNSKIQEEINKLI